MKQILTSEELADLLQISNRTLYRMLENAELPFAFKVKGSWRFKKDDLEQWIESQKQLVAQKK